MARPGQDSPGVTRSGWQGVARSGFVRSARARHGAAGKTWPGLAPRLADGWSGMAERAWIGAAGMERRGPSSIGKDPQAWSDVDYQARHGSAGLATQGWARTTPARLAWICIAAIGWDCPGVAGMARWACNVAAGMDRHDQVGVKPRGRHGVARSGCASAASQAWHGLALQGLALRGWLGSSWKRFARLASAGMAANATTW